MSTLKGIPKSETTPGLFYLVNWAVTRVTGVGDLGIRALSLATGVVLIPVVFVLSRWVAGRTAGLIAAGLCAVHPLLLWYSADARSYSSLLLLSAVGWLAFARLVERPTVDRLLQWSVLACLTLALHYFAAFIVAGQFLWLAMTQPPIRRPVVLSGFLLAAVGAAAAPTWATQVPAINPYASIPLLSRLSDAAGMAVVGVSPPIWPLAAPGLILVALATVFVFRAAPTETSSRARHLLGAAILGVILALLGGSDYLIGRNIIGVWPVLIAVWAAGIGLAPRGAALIAGGGLVAVALAASAGLLTDQRLQRPDWRQAAVVVGQKRPGLAVVVVGGYYAGAMTEYLDTAVVPAADAREIVAIGAAAPEGRRGCYNGPMCSVTRAEPAEQPLPGLHLIDRQRTGLWRIATYRAETAVHVDATNVGRFFNASRPFQPPIIYAPRP